MNKHKIQKTVAGIVSHDEMMKCFENTNFGGDSERFVIAEAVIQIASGYNTGFTAMVICQELGLVGKRTARREYNLTKKGKKYLYWSQKLLRCEDE